MRSISRRSFLRQTGTGAASLGAMSAIGLHLPLFGRRTRIEHSVHDRGVASPAGQAHNGPFVVHVADPRTGELRLMVGTREVVRHDPALVARLVHATG